MGYRNQFMLVVEGTDAQLEKLLAWANGRKEEELAKDALESEARRLSRFGWSVGESWSNLLRCLEPNRNTSNSGVGLTFTHDYMKCYDSWDEVVEEFHKFCTDNGVAFGYGRLGEDGADMEFDDNDLGIQIGYARHLCSPF